MTTTPKLFFSHSAKDKALLAELVSASRIGLNLNKGDIRCTSLDGYDVSTGDDIVARVRADGTESNSLIAIVTPESLRSTWVMFELGARWGVQRHFGVVVAAGAGFEDIPEPIRMRRARRCTLEDLEGLFLDIADELNTTFDLPAARRFLDNAARISNAMRQFHLESQVQSTIYNPSLRASGVVKFLRPTPDEIVQRHFDFEVELIASPASEKTLWLCHEVNGQLWPKASLVFHGNRSTGRSVEGGSPPGGAMTLTILELDEIGRQRVAAWVSHGQETGHYPGIKELPGSVLVASVRVIVET